MWWTIASSALSILGVLVAGRARYREYVESGGTTIRDRMSRRARREAAHKTASAGIDGRGTVETSGVVEMGDGASADDVRVFVNQLARKTSERDDGQDRRARDDDLRHRDRTAQTNARIDASEARQRAKTVAALRGEVVGACMVVTAAVLPIVPAIQSR